MPKKANERMEIGQQVMVRATSRVVRLSSNVRRFDSLARIEPSSPAEMSVAVYLTIFLFRYHALGKRRCHDPDSEGGSSSDDDSEDVDDVSEDSHHSSEYAYDTV